MTETIHPKAAESRRLASIRRVEAAVIKKAIAEQKVHFHTVGNYTFCYRVERRNVIDVSSSIRHPNDKHDAHVGKREALARFMSAQRMLMRVPTGNTPRHFLNFIFGR